MTDGLHALTCTLPVCPKCSIRALEHYEFALFKRSNGHQVGGPVRVREGADPRLRGLKPERYIVRRRAVYTGPWEDA